MAAEGDGTLGGARIKGGRSAAEAALSKIKPEAYARNRNFLDGDVTHLSPYLRHGVLSLAEVRDHALRLVKNEADAEKFISELGWRDYWQRLYEVLGDGVWVDREAYKTGRSAAEYADELPDGVIAGTTGLACMDGFSQELRGTGYLHNHARMWFAAWVVHWLHVRWQAGARWFLRELLDADVASNNMSWQWVASTFAGKAYFFNRENLERYTNGKYCRSCIKSNDCPFDATYEDLEAKLFPKLYSIEASMPSAPLPRAIRTQISVDASEPVLVWVHTGSLNPRSAVHDKHVGAASCFVWDKAWMEEERPSMHRQAFVQECLAEMPTTMMIRHGDVAEEIVAAARVVGARSVVALSTTDARIVRIAEAIQRQLPLAWVRGREFVRADSLDLKRFSRYWSRVKTQAMQPTRD